MTQSPQPVGIPSKPRLGYSTLWTFLKIALALLLVGVVLSRTNLSELMALRQEIVLSWLLISFFLFFLMVFLKTLQYYVFLSSKIDYWKLLQAVVLQNALMNFVATGLGIVSLTATLKVEHKVRIRDSSLAFLATKVGDFFAIWCFLVVSSWLVWEKVAVLHGIVLGLIAFLGLVLMSLAIAVIARSTFLRILLRFQQSSFIRDAGWIKRVLEELEGVLRGVSEKKVWWKVLLLSQVYLGVTMLWMYASLRALGLEMEITGIVFVNMFTQLLSNLPIYVFGGLGVSEVTGLYLYGIFYPDQKRLATSLIGFRLLFYLANLLILIEIPAYIAFKRNEITGHKVKCLVLEDEEDEEQGREGK
jgi:uncharacterized membrane protein YbhN (UPF0104 family)